MPQEIIREEILLTFDGPAVQNHEMEVSVLANSLIAFKDLAERVNFAMNGKDADLLIKVNGGFKEGSFKVSFLLDSINVLNTKFHQLISSFSNIIDIIKFLKGKDIQKIEKTADGMLIQNFLGEKTTFNNCDNITINLVNNVAVKRDVANIARPLNDGIDKISFTPLSPGLSGVEILQEDKSAFIPPNDDAVEMETGFLALELLTTNFDGKQAGWRFFDPENAVEFSASVRDEAFLSKVKLKEYNFQSGDILKVELTKIKRKTNQRYRTERFIDKVISHVRPDN
jgi:hypothetical protein